MDLSDPLARDFFTRSTRQVADDLLGCYLNYNDQGGIITETESYIGSDDPACHARFGKTKRTAPMFKAGGHLYVYLIYGIHHCANIITEGSGFPAGVLLRGIIGSDGTHYDGPGKLTKYLGMDRGDSGRDIVSDPALAIYRGVYIPSDKIKHTPRIGIRQGVEREWRSVLSSEKITDIQHQFKTR
jgi:DNA-3-methyladenine glycosylase